jgi:hypothetical protein
MDGDGRKLATPPRTLNQRAQAQDLSGAQGKTGDTRQPYKIDGGDNDTGEAQALRIYAR